MERRGITFEQFCSKSVQNCHGKKSYYGFFFNLFIFEVLFKHLFAPTSQSRMFKNFRDSESLGKNNVVLSLSVKRCFVSRMRDFFLHFNPGYNLHFVTCYHLCNFILSEILPTLTFFVAVIYSYIYIFF